MVSVPQPFGSVVSIRFSAPAGSDTSASASTDASAGPKPGSAATIASSHSPATPASEADGIPSPAGMSWSASTREARAGLVVEEGAHAATACSRRLAISASVLRSASAAIVAVGFIPADVGHVLPSKTNRFGMSCVRP